ncbi:MAG TPA: radical SAM protein [Methanomicrobiales archaeon]|nr:radical SAM protein [Methanomicrobiales archaeon]
MSSSAVVLDGYVDEPACLGVPPYLAPQARALAGVLSCHGYRVAYHTIDQLRGDPSLLLSLDEADLVAMVAGVTVPGKYLAGTPATLGEVELVASTLRHARTFLGGPILFGYAPGGGERALRREIAGFSVLLEGSPAEALDSYLAGGEARGAGDYRRLTGWLVAGARIIPQHPSFPHLMCELETATGCSRGVTGGCSFCTEPFYGPPRFRTPGEVAAEVAALSAQGARHFRLGRQPDLLTYGVSGGEFPRPDPEKLRDLFHGVREAAPDLLTLHVDNVNPGTIARHEEASREALRAIVAGHTAGDVAAFGMETADPAVVAANNLKASPEQVMQAIRVVNEEGGMRREGIPGLLPGLNFVIGLAGETGETFRLNGEFLSRVLSEGLLVRRVNIRKLMAFPGTRAYRDNTLGRHDGLFRRWKEQVRRDFDHPMVSRVFPLGTVLRRVIVEVSGKTSFGRQMGSYPVLVGVPLAVPVREVIDAVVVDWGMRSITALPYPVAVNTLPLPALAWLPGIGRKRAASIAAARPFGDLRAFRAVAGETPLDAALSFGPARPTPP